MSDFFLIFSQASETHLVVKIRGLSAGTNLLTSLTLTFRDGPLCWGVGGSLSGEFSSIFLSLPLLIKQK